MSKTVLGIYSDSSDAENAINMLKDKGYNAKDISIVMKNTHVAEKIQQELVVVGIERSEIRIEQYNAQIVREFTDKFLNDLNFF